MGRKSTKTPLACLYCGKTFLIPAADIAKGTHVYCSHLCANRATKKTHGETVHGVLSPEYKIWRSLKDRCFNPKNEQFHHYGGRGITIHDAWRDDFPAFLLEIGRRPSPELTLERINNERGYVPGNLRWATRKEQAWNRRNTYWLTINGVRQPLSAWASEYKISRDLIKSRLNEGWDPVRALTTPATHSKITASDIWQIFSWLEDGATQKMIAQKLFTNQTTISSVLTGRTWRHLTLGVLVPILYWQYRTDLNRSAKE
jgi:hypothetical protein